MGTKRVTTVMILINDHNLMPEVTGMETVAMVVEVTVAVTKDHPDIQIIPNSPPMQHYCHPFNAVKNVI